jgi:23S rRNA pseudouridine1911/1915/1917 synthase
MIQGKKNFFKKAVKPEFHSYPVKETSELMKFLMVTLPGKSRDNIKTLLKKKLVEVDGRVETKFNHPLAPGQKVSIRPKSGSVEQKKYTGVEIVFEDKDILVINKDAGLLTIANNKETKKTAYAILSEHVKKKNKDAKIFIVHRLDRETSGLLLFAKSEEIKVKLQENWNDNILERTYLALIEGKLEKPHGVYTSFLIESPSSLLVHSSQNAAKGQKAVTHYKTIVSKRGVSLMEVNLETGRKNQIRVHFQDLKHPVVGDKKYGATNHSLGRLGLHAKVLAFKHPKTGNVVRFESETPKKFLKLL